MKKATISNVSLKNMYIEVRHCETEEYGMGREVGGGFRSGNLCTPVADSCRCMAKPIQYCKVKKKKK